MAADELDEREEEDAMSGGAATLHAPVLETLVTVSSARVRPRVTNGGGGKAGNHDEKDATSGGVTTLHTLILETSAAGPSARVRPRVTDGWGIKAHDQSDIEDARPGIGICHGKRKREIRSMQYGWWRAKRASMHSEESQ